MDTSNHMTTANLLLSGLMFGPEYGGYFESFVYYLTILQQESQSSVAKKQVDALFLVALLSDFHHDYLEKLIEEFLLPLEPGEPRSTAAVGILNELVDLAICATDEELSSCIRVIRSASFVLWPVLTETSKEQLTEAMEGLLQD